MPFRPLKPMPQSRGRTLPSGWRRALHSPHYLPRPCCIPVATHCTLSRARPCRPGAFFVCGEGTPHSPSLLLAQRWSWKCPVPWLAIPTVPCPALGCSSSVPHWISNGGGAATALLHQRCTRGQHGCRVLRRAVDEGPQGCFPCHFGCGAANVRCCIHATGEMVGIVGVVRAWHQLPVTTLGAGGSGRGRGAGADVRGQCWQRPAKGPFLLAGDGSQGHDGQPVFHCF